jgi:hypothetical protein
MTLFSYVWIETEMGLAVLCCNNYLHTLVSNGRPRYINLKHMWDKNCLNCKLKLKGE